MSLLLSNYRKRRYKGGHGGRRSTGVGAGAHSETTTVPGAANGTGPRPKNAAGAPPHPTTARQSMVGNAQNMASVTEPQSEFDEYGTELHPDARVWKVYVQEADKYDEELVKGWNDSTDVILIFAALFSAISTAFLIESSKMLQPDPADTSAQTLATISHTLLSLANGTQLSGSLPSPSDPPVEFVPSRTAIYVNMLWYLSLSLSLATSFIAILSKDWCHAFMSGRTGHHYAQTCRRQQKWDMIERWKMSELLAVLPSLIHIALLLFSVGLSILLWDMHNIIAIPVVCISGLAFGFYIWSSATAIVLDSFPYPTIVSKLCRTEPVQLTYQVAVQSPRQFLWLLVYVAVRPLKYLFDRLYSLSDRLSDYSSSWRNALVRRPAYWVWLRLENSSWRSLTAEQWICKQFKRPEWRLEARRPETKPYSQGNAGDTALNEVKSLALGWLITNCEVPRSVDAALQSIAGAGQGFDPAPLLKCNSTLEILRRLASGNLYRDRNAETVVLLYSRALSFLGSSTNKSENGKSSGDSLEVLIWSMQTIIESNVAVLIGDGQFQPTKQNMNALRIGNTAASSGLRLLKGDDEGANVLFDSIVTLMEQHLSKEAPLHPAALLSLVSATALLLLFSLDMVVARSIRKLCVSLASDAQYGNLVKLRIALITCATISTAWIGYDNVLPARENSPTTRAIQSLIAFQSQDEQSLRTVLEFGLKDLWNSTWLGYPGNGNSKTATPVTDEANSQFLWGIQQLLPRGDDYENISCPWIDIIHSLRPFAPTDWKLGGKSETESVLVGIIWNLAEELKQKLAIFISDGTFTPTQNNLRALRLGSDMALISGKILTEVPKQGEIEGIVNAIIALLKSHLDHTNVLHDAALLSVTYAAALLCLISPTSINARQTSSTQLPAPQTTPDNPLGHSDEPAPDCHTVDAPILPSLCRQLAADHSSVGLITVFAKTSLLWFNMHVDHTRANSSRTGELVWKVEAVRGLVEICSEDKETLGVINDCIELLIEATPTLEQASKLDLSLSQLNHNFLSNTAKTISTIPRMTSPELEGGSGNQLQDDIAPQLRALHAIYRLTGTTVLSPAIYVLIVEVMCRTPPSSPLFACGAQMLSKCPFPTLSEDLATALEQQDLVPLLETTSTSDNQTKRYFAQGQLWLLLSLYIYAGDTASGRDKLKVQLDKCRANGNKSEEGRHWYLGARLYGEVQPGNSIARELGVWAWRLEECVRRRYYVDIEEYIRGALRDVPPELRGMSSFTAWPQRAGGPSMNEPQPVGEVTDEVRERTDATNLTTEGEGPTGRDGQLQRVGLVADTEEAGTQGEDDAGRADSSQDYEASARAPPVGDGKNLADVNSQEEVGKVQGEGNSGVEAVGDERRVADAGDATEATDGPQSEGEEAESEDVAHDGGKESHRVIDMGGLENESNRPASSV